MLTRRTGVAPQDKFYSDSLLTIPSASSTAFHNLAAGFATPGIVAAAVDGEYAKKPEGQAILSAYNATQMENETPGMSTSQWLLGEGANMLGQALNPITWGLGELGGLASKGIVAGASKVAPDAAKVLMRRPLKELVGKSAGEFIPSTIGKEAGEKPLSLGLMSEKTLDNFGVFAGAGAPQAVVDNYNQDTQHIAWGGVARSMGEMGAFGMAIGSVPFAFGILRGKVNRGLGNDATEAVDQSSLDKAMEQGHITPEEHSWYSDYLDHQKNPGDEKMAEDLKSRATDLINKNGHTANVATNEAMFEMLRPEDMSNLQGAIPDQLAGNVPEKYRTALSDFIIHKRFDSMRDAPNLLDGVRGYVDFVGEKLKSKAEKLAEHDRILDDHMLKAVKDNMPFSQKEILRHIKKAGFEASHISHLPLTIPKNIKSIINLSQRAKELNLKLKKLEKQGLRKNNATYRKLVEIEEKIPKILTPKEELSHLRNTLLSKGLSRDFHLSPEYHRLMDLSNVWHNARTLLDRIHVEHEYNKQEAFRDLAHQTLKIADSNTTRMAKPENVIDYMRKRIEGSLEKVQSLPEIVRATSDKESVPTDADSILDEQERQVKDTQADNAKKDFNQSKDRFVEFKKSENIFKNLISCVMGGLGG